MKKFTLLLFFLGSIIAVLSAQVSPPDLNSDVTGVQFPDFSTVEKTETLFNDARRQEETQLGLAANSIKDLDLPAQSVWNSYSADQKMLFLLNDERTARAGINYGSGAVGGLPFQGVEATIDGVAQAFAQVLYNDVAFAHNHNGTTPTSRINAAISNSCKEFNSFSENLYAAAESAASTFPNAVEKAVFGWNYRDAGSTWGHRRMNLSQSFNNNNGEANQEGFIGIGIVSGDNYPIFGPDFPHGVVVVLNYFDPVADASAGACNYNVTVTTNSLSSGGGSCVAAVTANSANGNANINATNTITTTGTVTVTGTVAYKAGMSITLNDGFTAQQGSSFSASIVACTGFADNQPEVAAIQRNNNQPILSKEPRVFPNPFNANFTVQYNLSESSPVSIEVFNINGQKVNAKNILDHQPTGFNQIELNGSDWMPGMYLIQIRAKDQFWTKRLVKH